jgi:pilus assembly protein CpaF
VLKEIREMVNEEMDINRELSDDEVRELIVKAVFKKSEEVRMSFDEKKDLIEKVFNSMRRFDILQPLLDDNTVSEIMVNGSDEIFIERKGGIEKLDIKFASRERLEDVIQSIVAKANRTVNQSSPIVDARLPDGSRLNAILQPIALNGPILTIRKFSENPLTLNDMVTGGTLSEQAAEALDYLVKAKYNIFICGGTGSGKTTLLNALAGRIPPDERIVTIEDSAELQLKDVVNIVRMETRDANSEGKGQITIRDLIRTALRCRPERIIVGEVRGPEALDMLQAMNTGHEGSLSTGHANSTIDSISRLETMVLSAARLPIEVVRQQIASALDIVIHISRMRDKSRRVLDISELVGIYNGEVRLNSLFTFREDSSGRQLGKDGLAGKLVRTGISLSNTQKLEMAGLKWRL